MPLRRWSHGLVLGLCLIQGGQGQEVDRPAVAGIALGLTADRVRDILGTPDRVDESLGMRFWEYSGRGVTLIWKEGVAGVQGIIASSAAAGSVEGVTIGDPGSRLRALWGAPARVRQDGRFLDFVGAGWVLSAELLAKKVVQITLMAASAATH